jgi:EmrB/QacA subfamily drug resistance transporter
VIGLGLLMAILDITIVSVVLPQIAAALGADYQNTTWIGTGYLLANAAVIPMVGYLSDRIGSKTIFLLALGVFIVGSALCAVASSVQALTAFRVFQGVGGGALVPVGMAIVFRLFDPAERAAATSMLMIPILLGPAFGPTLRGWLATAASWNAIFLTNLPIGIVAFVLAVLVLRGKTEEQAANGDIKVTERPHFDWLGLVLATASFTALVYGFTQAGTDGWYAPTVTRGSSGRLFPARRLCPGRATRRRSGNGPPLVPQLHLHHRQRAGVDLVGCLLRRTVPRAVLFRARPTSVRS